MHGHKRAEYKAHQRDPKIAAGLAKKAAQWHTVNNELAVQRKAESASVHQQILLLDKLLAVNPDPLYLWNHRRELIQSTFEIQKELAVSQTALQSNPKAYGAWLHRKWTIQQAEKLDSETALESLLSSELALTALFLQRDERNFHCWNYRRFIVGCLLGSSDGSWKCVLGYSIGPQLADCAPVSRDISSESKELIMKREWDFSTSKIEANFSNFSAFFLRSQLLPWKMSNGNKFDLISQELKMVESAVFTEPDDQSAWWYHHCLLNVDVFQNKQNIAPEFHELLKCHLEDLKELSAEVPACKWVFLGIWHVLETQPECSDDSLKLATLTTLLEVDPDRANRYKYLIEKKRQP